VAPIAMLPVCETSINTPISILLHDKP
jgi:hypothetical protein